MSKSSFKNILSSSIWGILAKILDAVAKFVTIPLLVRYFGKGDYGLIALAFALNAYLRLMDMGMNIGSIRFFSMWIAQKEWDKIGKVSRSSIVFYGGIGLINALIFVFMAQYSGSYFKLTPEQIPIFKWIMYVLAASTVFNWTSSVISQLLSAHDEIAWINRVSVISSVLNFVTAIVAVKCKMQMSTYFVLFTLSTLIVIPVNIYRLKVYKVPILQLLAPKWDGRAFKEILGYSVAIFAMGIFQFSADNLRPILLGKYASNGIAALTDYRVIQTITMLIIAIGGVFLDVLLPSAAKIYAENDTAKMENMVFKGTRYISIFLSFIVFALITNSKTLLTLYMGAEYNKLSIWLSLWLGTVLLAMHNTPISSLVLSSGKTKVLVFTSAASCLLSLPITIFLAPKLNIGGAMIGYAFYVLFQISCYYLYYTPKVLKLNSKKIFFNSFFPAASVGIISWLIARFIQTNYLRLDFKSMVISSVIFSILFIGLLLLFVVKPKEIRELKGRFL